MFVLFQIDPVRDLLYIKGAVPGPNGGFLRVVDAVKGPFFPSPPPLPTYLVSSADPLYPTSAVLAPVSEHDKWDLKEPEDAY